MPASSCLRVVVADDSDVVRQLVIAALAEVEAVCIVGEAADGLEALETLRATPSDVLVLDLNMPRADGLFVLRALRDAAQAPRVLVLTQHTAPEYRDACAGLGAEGFYDKAHDLARVADVLRGWAVA